MKKMLKRIAALFLCVCLLSGCTKSTILEPEVTESAPGDLDPDEIMWDDLWDGWTNTYTDPEVYPFAMTVNCSIYPDEGIVRFFLLLNTEVSVEEAQAYAMDVVKGLGDAIADQNDNCTHTSDTSYGSFLDGYDIYVMVSEDAVKADRGSWILEDTIPAGEGRAIQIPAAE